MIKVYFFYSPLFELKANILVFWSLRYTSAGVSTGGSSSNSGNVRLLTHVSSGFVEDLSSSGRYNGGSLHHFRVLQELSCPIHDMSSTDDDGHWEFAHDVEDLSHVRTVTYVPQPGDPLKYSWTQVRMAVHFLSVLVTWVFLLEVHMA